MAYRRPGVTVTQVFVGLVPALAAFSLPSVTVGPAYKLIDGDDLGSYAGAETTYNYASAPGGSVPDIEVLAEDELFPITKKPIEVTLKDVKAEVLAEQTNAGYAKASTFTDPTADVFSDVEEGDVLVVVEKAGVEVVAPKTDGIADEANPTWLTEGTAGDFDQVKPGDSVVVTGGTNVLPGTYAVIAKAAGGILILGGSISDGVAPSVDVAYSISGLRGDKNVGLYTVKSITDVNTLVLSSPVVEEEYLISYYIQRDMDDVVLERGTEFTADVEGITILDGVMADALPIISASVYADYRALRTDLASEPKEYGSVTDLEATFGVGQITPANPLAYGLSLMLQNTVTPVSGLGLSADYATDEALAFTKASDALALVDMYAIALLSHSPVVHTMFKNHVEQLSVPSRKLERIALVNSKLNLISVLQEESTTVDTLNGSRGVVGTQINGLQDGVTLDKLTSPTADIFEDVLPGDRVVIQSGTNVTPGTYVVKSVTDGENLVTVLPFGTGGGVSTDIQFYVARLDGLGADGKSFYDRNAAYLSDGIAAGHSLTITEGALAGRYKIGSIVSDKELILESAILGVASAVVSVSYQVDRDFTKAEQAANVKGYGESLGSRRVVHTWPDVLKAPVGQSIEEVPGYYAGSVVAALVTGLPTQQGFTNLSVSGFLGLNHSTKYFSEAQLDVIADGGNFILGQDGPNQPLYVRHQLTTDRSAVKFQELSVTKNVDFIAKFLRTTYAPFIGVYNIVDTTMDTLQATATAAITFLKEKTVFPKIGGVIRSGSLSLIEEDPNQLDTVNMRFSFQIPLPLNNIDIVIEV